MRAEPGPGHPPLQSTHLGTRHPDLGWIEEARGALDRWATADPSSPTSSVLGGGAIAAAEAAFSDLHSGRPALLLPSASYALRVGLLALGVTADDEVICAAIDWPAGFAAIASLGATPVRVAVDPQTLTLDPGAAAAARTRQTRAVVACHLHGICADVPAIRLLLPGVGILEDAAQAFGCRLDGRLAGTLGDAAVLSLGPGKQIDAGEGGVLLCDRVARHEQAIAAACHPLRQLLTGMPDPDPVAFAIRPHPMAAVLALHRLAGWSPTAAQSAHAETARRLAGDGSVRLLGDSRRHESSLAHVPVLLSARRAEEPPPGVRWSRSGAQVLPGLTGNDHELTTRLLARVRLATCTSPVPGG
jgi:dTDP-4-amino-4,6-dideoxygalactose transaminase